MMATSLCPERIAIIGGGRWARVLTEVLCTLAPTSVELSVHSLHNAQAMSTWAAARGLGDRIRVSSEWPEFRPSESGAAIIANSARDHEKAVEWALLARVPALVEKPIALTGANAQRLLDMAHSRDVRLAAAHVFLFARYLDEFSRLVASSSQLHSLRVHWTDPKSEERYGEEKQYDPSLPIVSDWLPHVVSIIGVLIQEAPTQCQLKRCERGCARVDLDIFMGNTLCSVELARNSDQRRRVVEVSTGTELLRLDFSREPGTIIRGTSATLGDPHWETKKRPVASMMTAFLEWAAGGAMDWRLDVNIALRACHVIDQVSVPYRAAMMDWLRARLAARQQVDDDLRYALSELLQSDGRIAKPRIDEMIERLHREFSGTERARLLTELASAPEPAKLLAAVAG